MTSIKPNQKKVVHNRWLVAESVEQQVEVVAGIEAQVQVFEPATYWGAVPVGCERRVPYQAVHV